MFKDIRNLIKHSSIYTFGNFASKILGILLVPLYTKVIAVELYGVYSILEVTQQFLVGILHLGLPNALIRWLSLDEYKEKKESIIFSVFVSTIFIASFIFLIIFIFRTQISQLFFDTTEYTGSLTLVALIIGFRLLNRIGLTHIRFKEKSLLFITISISRFFIQLIVTIYLVAFLRVGILGIFGGQLSGEIISFIFLFPYLTERYSSRFDFTEIRKMLSYGYPLAFSGISSRILNVGDRYILGYLSSMKVVGIYSLGYKFANLVDTMFIKSFRTAFLPKAWKKLQEENAKRFYAKLLTYFVFFTFWVALFLSVYAKGIIHLFARNNSYWDAYLIAPIAAFAIAIKGMFSIIKMGMQFKQQTKYIAYIVSTSAVLNILLNFALIPLYDMIGAALATIISFTFMVMAGYFYSNRFYPVKFEWIRIGKIVIAIGIIYFSSYLVNPLPLSARIIAKLILLLLYPVVLYLLKFYDYFEIKRIWGAWKKWRDPRKWKENFKDIKLQ